MKEPISCFLLALVAEFGVVLTDEKPVETTDDDREDKRELTDLQLASCFDFCCFGCCCCLFVSGVDLAEELDALDVGEVEERDDGFVVVVFMAIEAEAEDEDEDEEDRTSRPG